MTGSKLKWIATLSMLIDHFGVVIVWPFILANPTLHGTENHLNATGLVVLYEMMRLIGRIAFPIFIFLLIQGFSHTHNRITYLVRVLVFAIISELPFDLAFNLSSQDIKEGRLIEFDRQNVFFTLAIGLFSIIVIDAVLNLCKDENIRAMSVAFVGIASLGLAYVLQGDYKVMGVLAIMLAYAFRQSIAKEMLVCILVLSVASVTEVFALAGLPFVLKYNGQRGKANKWFFYVFYPAHLLVFVALCALCNNY